MVWAPTRPSPMAAPMAPPASAMPPPMKAPPDFSPVMGSLPWARTDCTSDIDAPSELVRSRVGGAGRPPGAVGDGEDLVALLAHGGGEELHDGEQREEQRLDGADEEVEELPRGVREPEAPPRDERDHRDHDRAREDVAEQSQRERDRLGDLFDDVQRGERDIGLHEPLQRPCALLPEAPDPGGDEDEQRECVGHVHVGRRRPEDLGVTGGEQPDPVREQDEGEQRDGQRREELGRAAAHAALHLLDHVVGEGLVAQLHLVGDLGRHPRADEEPEADDEDRGEGRGPHRVAVERHAEELELADVLAGRDRAAAALGGEREETGRHLRSSLSAGTDPTIVLMTWNSASPRKVPRPVGKKKRARATATTVTMASRAPTPRTSAALLGRSAADARSTDRWTMSELAAPSASPKQPKAAMPPAPNTTPATSARTPMTSAMIRERRKASRVAPGTVSIGP